MENFDKGFTLLMHSIGNMIPLLDLTEREYRLVLLIIRLTYGCNRRWAKLKLYDLQTINVAPSHAREVRDPLLEREIIVQNGNKKEYRLNEEYITSKIAQDSEAKLERLRSLVGRQLSKETSPSSNKLLPELGSSELPNEEVPTSQNGNINDLPETEVLALKESSFRSPKDILNKDKYKDIKDRISYKRSGKHINPEFFFPKNDVEFEMMESFKLLDNANPDSFSYYVSSLQRGLPAFKFREFREDILRTPNVKNKGALFVKKVEEYFKNAA